MTRSVFIGTSGWQLMNYYPTEIPSSQKLTYYAQHLNTVELNSTFYHLSRPATFQKRFDETPSGFIFALKANRLFTHDFPLQDSEGKWNTFTDGFKNLREKLGPILFQFPPSFEFDPGLLRRWFKKLDGSYKYAFEFRHPSWFCTETFSILEKNKSALCIYDLKNTQPPKIATTSWSYFRLHGPLKLPYRGSYSEDALRSWAEVLHQDQFRLQDIYFYFDNTMEGVGIQNAISLKKILSQEGYRAGPPRADL